MSLEFLLNKKFNREHKKYASVSALHSWCYFLLFQENISHFNQIIQIEYRDLSKSTIIDISSNNDPVICRMIIIQHKNHSTILLPRNARTQY